MTCSAVVERAGCRSADLGEGGGWTQVARRERRVSTTQQQPQQQEKEEQEQEKEPEERRERRLLLIYLHDETLPSSRSFCSQVANIKESRKTRKLTHTGIVNIDKSGYHKQLSVLWQLSRDIMVVTAGQLLLDSWFIGYTYITRSFHILTDFPAVLLVIATLSQRHLQCCGSGSGLGSGSGRIRIILPDLDRYQFRAHVFLNFSPTNFNMLSKILKIMTPLPFTRKENHRKLGLI